MMNTTWLHGAKIGLMLTLPLAGLLLLSGCGNDNMRDLHVWVAKIKARPGPKLDPIPKLEPYEPYSYPDTGLRSPFVGVQPKKVSNVHPNLDRKKQYLENFPLDALKFVGEISFGGTTYALICDPNGEVHRVRDGNYMGQNNGHVTAILDGKIKLVEIVPDGTGSYQKRPATLELAQQNGD
jgi:type IV pilus assembly protein PilP